MTNPEIDAVIAGLSGFARKTIFDGDDHDWYARTERAAEQLEHHGLARRPFSHDRRACVPTTLGLAVRDRLTNQPETK